jgi:hypothetical protein
MTAPEPRKVTIVMHDKDGYPTTDKNKAVSAEVEQVEEDGSVTHTLMVDPARKGRGVFDA